MTDELYTKQERDMNVVGVEAVRRDLRQFKKLCHLSDPDVAHRMAVSTNVVRTFRKECGQFNYDLKQVGIDYAVRVILGKHHISTISDLFKYSDRALLALEDIGPARLVHIRNKLKEFFG